MRRLLATMSNVDPLLPGALLGACLNFAASDVAISDPVEPAAVETIAPAVATCDVESMVADHQSAVVELPCVTDAKTFSGTAEARAYLVETAMPGGTMTRQGPELAIGRLHPDFAARLASAIREARDAGLSSAGVFSAYRPPAFGVGGFSDKFNSLHTYGLAVDMHGIGRPGSAEARRWHEIAAKHGVVCPYGPSNRAEWNHCQPTRLKIVRAENPLRETVSAAGPLDLKRMFQAGSAIIESLESAIASFITGKPLHLAAVHESTAGKVVRSRRRVASSEKTSRSRLKNGRTKIARRSGDKVRIKTDVKGRSTIVVEERRKSRKTAQRSAASKQTRKARLASSTAHLTAYAHAR
jgi:hypothetical protein